MGATNGIQKQQAECIRQTAEKTLSKLGDLLNCGKQADLNQANHDLLKLFHHATLLLEPYIEKKQLTLEVPNDSVLVTVDGWQFEQVLQNLLDNAIYFSPIGGTITVDWQLFQYEVLVTISDQGPGFGDVDFSKLFSPFYSQRPGGTGLGLAIAKKIILDHQGSISAKTLSEGGAQFLIVLPR